jgi:ubiquinone/menaquinone biosynthesis C-methylase UbiE
MTKHLKMRREDCGNWIKETNRKHMDKRLHYFFDYVNRCEMCNDSVVNHKVLGQRLNRSQGSNPKNKIGISVSVVKCSKCGLIYSNPMPVPFDFQDHYGVPPEDYWTPDYFTVDTNYFGDQIKRLKTIYHFKQGAKALDVGAGIGKCLLALKDAGFDAWGLEPSKQFYERAITKMGIDDARLKLGMIEDVDYPECTFDFINFGAVLEHFYRPAYCIDKAMRWLKPGGLMHIEVPAGDYLIAKFINYYNKLIGTNYVTNLSPMHDPFHLYEFSIASFKALSNESREFDIVFHEHYVCSAEPFPKFMRGLMNKIMAKTNTGMQLAVWLKKRQP